MTAPAAGAWKTPGTLALIAVGVLGIFMYLVPAGSYPVGFDVFWNLHVARTWAETGFPAALPEAGFTQLARAYADRQLGFHALLALSGGAALDTSLVPPFVWGLALAQVFVVFGCMRWLAPRASVLWLLLLPALSSTWIFRLTACRDMSLAVLVLLALVSALARPGAPSGRRCVVVAALACVFGYIHGAFVLPLALALATALGRRIAGESFGWRSVWAVAVGMVPALVLRPDFPHNIELLLTLNVRMPLGALSGELPIQPVEFAARSLGHVLGTSAWLLALAVVLMWQLVKDPPARSITLVAVLLCVGSLFGSRLIELAVPFAVLAIGVSRPRIPAPVGVAVVVALACFGWVVLRQVPLAERSVAASRYSDLEAVGSWLDENGKKGDVVFVTDWAVSSPLAWWTRDRDLVFTGMTDPSLMWVEDRRRFEAWWAFKTARDPDPVATLRQLFGARFVVVEGSDHAPQGRTGETSTYLWKALGVAHRAGLSIASADIGRFKCYRLGP